MAARLHHELDWWHVVLNHHLLQFERLANDRLHWTETWEDADFFISPTHMACDTMLDGKVVATVERLGVVIGVVKDRRAILAANRKQDTIEPEPSTFDTASAPRSLIRPPRTPTRPPETNGR